MALNIKMYLKLLFMKIPFFFILLISILVFGCTDTDKIEEEIVKIKVDVNVSRFDREFARAKEADIPFLKKTYPFLFPKKYPDSIWVTKLQDPIQVELFAEVGKTFPNLTQETEELKSLFQHIKYYFPQYKIPKVITMTSEVDYNSRVIWADTLLLLGLDNYLGPEHKFYKGLQNYITSGMDKKFMVSDVAGAFARKVVPRLSDRTFLSEMIYFGKIMYLKDKLMPFASDAQKMVFTQDQLDWAEVNEEPIWRNFIEQEHLYSTDKALRLRFLDPAPFSKFGLELDNESPGRIGRYLGWQIVRSFMDKNEVTLPQLLNFSADEIFKKSSYKPKK